MKVLLLHPEDSPWAGAWIRERWDLVVDLGYASSGTYEEWSRKLGGARVLSVHQYAGQMEGYRWVNRALEQGRGKLLDRMGLDWWELLAVWSYQELHSLYLLDSLVRCEISRSEMSAHRLELAATRPHLLARILGRSLERSLERSLGRSSERSSEQPVRYFQAEGGAVRRVSRMLRSARRLRPAQIAEIALDKWDAGYRVRRHFNKGRRADLKDPVVLLPSTYSNVTRSELAYAGQLPGRHFLLAATRQSAMPERLPGNVTASPLAAYALPSSATEREALELRKAWEDFRRNTLPELKEFEPAMDAGLWDYFPAHLENGLRLREAWRNLLESEPVAGVLCGDDLNYYTRLPLILAQRSGRNAVYCSHGALDGGFLFKRPTADSYLVKGEMESEYLQRARAIEPGRICVGAPGRNGLAERGDQAEGALVFFSQPFEVEGGRAEEIYRELLTPLCSVAFRTGRKLVVKLHPFESPGARQELVTSILPRSIHGRVEVVGGAPPEEVMGRAWCGVTVDSSVAVECTLRKIPFFLCGWLDFAGMGYLQQFARFGAGRLLHAAEDIENIPALVEEYRADPAALERLWHAADPGGLDEVLFGNQKVRLDPCA